MKLVANSARVDQHPPATGSQIMDTPRHAATLSKGTPGVLHGARSYLLQDHDGQIIEAHSISAGLDYPGVEFLAVLYYLLGILEMLAHLCK